MDYFEDLEVGRQRTLGSYTVSKSEIIDFAEKYDPMSFHLHDNPEPPTMFDRIIASGYQTLCLSNKIVVEEFRKSVAAVVGVGIEDLRWHEPVYPDDTLVVKLEIEEKRPATSFPDLGRINSRITTENTKGPVLTYVARGLIQKRQSA